MRVILVLALIGAACAVPKNSARIIGGEATDIENYPFMANMLYRWNQGGFAQFCGGTLITKTSVLSSAHCYETDHPSSWNVRLGSTLASSGGHVHTVSNIISHENYTSFINDVAIIKLSIPALLSNQIKLARIAGPGYILADNTRVHAIGWGHINWSADSVEELQHVGIYVINQQDCIDRYELVRGLPWAPNIPDITPGMICTGTLNTIGKDVCDGDFGGPIIHNRDVLVGIISFAYRCGHPFLPGINTRVSSYTDWIYNNSLN